MIHSYEINGVPVQTGDLICTSNGDDTIIAGQFWWFIGKLIPGKIDHIAIYIGPKGRAVEAGAKGKVVTYTIPDRPWNARSMVKSRGPIFDSFEGIAYPLKGKQLPPAKEAAIRKKVAKYCLKQAKEKKPYNLNFFNSSTAKAFYCSQLAYKAYLPNGINLNTGKGIPKFPGTKSIIFPQEIWSACSTRKPIS